MIEQNLLINGVYAKSSCAIKVDADSAYFVNLADIHTGLNDRKMVQDWLQYLYNIPNLYIGIGGDSTNGVTRNSKGNIQEEWCNGSQQIYALAEDLRPWVVSDRLLYIIKGNHGAGRMEDETFHVPEELLAWILGKPELYKGSQAFLYFNVRKNCYVHFAQHKSPKRKDNFTWINADVTWREHDHVTNYDWKMVLEHNKYEKRPIIKKVLEVNSGHWQILPSYVQSMGLRPTPSGCWITEMSGKQREHGLQIWSNEQLVQMVNRGYKF